MSRKKLCIITGTRADWGLFYPLANEIKKNNRIFQLQIIATGGHLIPGFGMTYKEIEKDNFNIDRKVRIPFSQDTGYSVAKATGLGIIRLAGALRSLKPDLVFLLGDRFETVASACAAFFLKIPVVHISGGELTEGSLDNTLRHVITKIASLHFVSTQTYRKRVIQMGEEPSTVFNVGALGLDNINNTRLLNRKEFEKSAGFKLGERNILVTYNPATLENKDVCQTELNNLLKAIDELEDTKIIFTKPNPDIYSRSIVNLIDEYVSKNKEKCISFVSMGRLLYLSALQFMDMVVGNSSSGLTEAPSFRIPTLNLGTRQKGRVRPRSVIDVDGRLKSIRNALRKGLSSRFGNSCRNVRNPYGNGKAAKRIIEIIKKIWIPSIRKSFFDVKSVYRNKD